LPRDVTFCYNWGMDKDLFRRKRERLGLTQEELAKRLGKNRLTIIRYEAGDSPIPKAVEMALKLIESEENR
jgi:transcriptional regulator with XRE-family HTH domain